MKGTRTLGMRFVLVGVLTIVVLASAAAIALAAVGYPADSVAVMTGCLTTSGTSAGNIGSVSVGSNPAKNCGSNQMLIHLSGGTITRVTAGTGVTLAGSGGTGGPGYINNGYASVGIDPKYQLPQSGCASGQFVASNGSGGWSCQDQKTYSGSDFALSGQSCDSGQFLTGFNTSGLKTCAADQTYSNGTGLDLSGNAFSLNPAYQLPQGCSNGQVAASDGKSGWTCTNAGGSPEGVSDLTDYTVTHVFELGDDDTGTISAFCNSGDIATGGGAAVEGDASLIYSTPDNSNGYEGWAAKASTGLFQYGSFTVSVKCLRTLQ